MAETPLQLLTGLKVVDFGVGMAAALVAKFLAEMGAEVHRVPPPTDDPFLNIYPAYDVWRREERVREDLSHSLELQKRLVESADICIMGGEDFPGLMPRRDSAELSRMFPRLVVLDIAGYPAASGNSSEQGTDILVQARAGIVFSLRPATPMPVSCQPANYGVVLQGLAGIGAALIERESSGRGQVVWTSLLEGSLFWIQPIWRTIERPTPRMTFYTPKDAIPIIVPCRDGVYLHIVLGGAGSKSRLYSILKINDPAVGPNESGLPDLSAGPEKFYGDIPVLTHYVALRESQELLPALWDAGIVVEPVLPPGQCWDDPQVKCNDIITKTSDGTETVGNPIQSRALAAAEKFDTATSDMPLAGIKVIDFGAFVAGPIASVGLGDLGADVIKVEPMSGDPMRVVYSSFFPANRGKRSIAIDMKSAEGLAIAHRLCESADVVCSNFRPGVAARLGIDGTSLQAKRPGIVVLNNPGYGSSGPKAQNAAFDPAMQAACGHEYRAGGVGNRPLCNRFTPVDYAGGAIGSVAVLFALYRRMRCREGAELTVPLLSVGVFLLSELIRSSAGIFAGGEPLDASQAGLHPAESLYQTADGWIAVCARDERSSQSLVSILGVDDRIRRRRKEWGEQESAILGAAVKMRSGLTLKHDLQQAGVWSEICCEDGVSAILEDPVLNANGTIYHDDTQQFGRISGIGSLFRLSRSKRESRGYLPKLGEHTREVLSALGYGAADIDSFYERKVVA
jgi:crotonobetainyl-CoA:carnitine CoA-transferase CaiB-like acyl-CoA transferase